MRLFVVSLLAICVAAATVNAPARAETPPACAEVDGVWDALFLLRKMQREDTPDLRDRLDAQLARLDVAALDSPTVASTVSALRRRLADGTGPVGLLRTARVKHLSAELRTQSISQGCTVRPVAGDPVEAGKARGGGTTASAPTDPSLETSTQRTSAKPDTAQSRANQTARGITMTQSVTAFLVMLGLVGGVAGLVWLRRVVQIRRQREERRMLFRTVAVQVGEAESQMTLVDLSMNGFKIKHEGFLGEAKRLFVELEGEWMSGEVRWANPQFAGVKFDRPIGAEMLAAVMEGAEG
ncbi:MAG: PilZ domain-containing protein [Litorimonas sp.]